MPWIENVKKRFTSTCNGFLHHLYCCGASASLRTIQNRRALKRSLILAGALVRAAAVARVWCVNNHMPIMTSLTPKAGNDAGSCASLKGAELVHGIITPRSRRSPVEAIFDIRHCTVEVAIEGWRVSCWPPLTYICHHETLTKTNRITHGEKLMKILKYTKLHYSTDCSKRSFSFFLE